MGVPAPGVAQPEVGTSHDFAVAVPPPDPAFAHSDITGAGVYAPPPDGISATDDGSVSITQILGTGYVSWKLAIFGIMLASVTRWYANATGCFASVRLATFTNVQLIRCGVISPIVRMASASAAAVSQAVAVTGATPVRVAVPRPRFGAIAGRIFDTLVGPPKAAVARSLGNDGGLMMRIGKLLALLYAAFLTVWFWATRLRWNGK